MEDDDRLHLQHMRDHARKACELIAGKLRSDFETDEVLRLALSYLVQIVGEAANHISQTTRQAYPEIPWQDIVGMRHRPVHG
ncbi:MAG: HepT-like ribonuclease domain-containing protein [Geminicoccaceae bacterium]